jgi:hypothetical protein
VELEDWYRVKRSGVYRRAPWLPATFGSLYHALQALYPQHPWTADKFRVGVRTLWSPRQQQTHVEAVAKELQLHTEQDWYQLSVAESSSKIPFMSRHGSLYKTLAYLYPHHSWNRAAFHSQWDDISRQKQRLDEIARELNFQSLDDWYHINCQSLYSKVPFIHHHGNVFNMLQHVYSEHAWSKEKWMKSQQLANNRLQLEALSQKFQVNNIQDWLSVSESAVSKKLKFVRAYGGMRNTLRVLYPEISWNDADLVNSGQQVNSQKQSNSALQKTKYWDELQHQRTRLEQLAPEFGVTELNDWYAVPRKQLYKRLPFIESYHGNLYNALCALYPQHPWNPLKFQRVVSGFWSNTSANDSLIKSVVNDLIRKYDVTQHSDWSAMSHDDLKLFQKIAKNAYSNVGSMLQSLYPNVHWKFQSSFYEHFLLQQLQTLTHVEIHPVIEGHSVDAYLPAWGVAIEYQGAQHYQQINTGDIHRRRRRDSEKEQALQQLGICLVKIPYWWNTSWHQLYATLMSVGKAKIDQ